MRQIKLKRLIQERVLDRVHCSIDDGHPVNVWVEVWKCLVGRNAGDIIAGIVDRVERDNAKS
jgi:hypothetical protein